ncbi:MAG: glycosyltransferase family 4 protein [Planctomycetes bacterium]|nr:glycosyltransferase family 4 protein [Planctomycetota bacterium]
MRVLHLIDLYDPKIGSSIRQMYQMADRMRADGVETEIVSVTQNPAEAAPVEIMGFRVHRILSDYPVRWRPIVSLRNRRVLGPLRGILASFKPDVVHAHLIHSHISYGALTLAKQSGASVVFTAHDVMTFCYQKLDCYHGGEAAGGLLRDYRAHWSKCVPCQRFRYFPPRNAMIRNIMNRDVDVKIAVSDALRIAIEANDLKNFRVVHNAIEIDGRPTDPAAAAGFRKKFELGGDLLFTIAGRVHELKGHLQAVKILAKVLPKCPRARLLVMGKKSEYEKYVGELTDALGVRARVTVTDWLDGEDLRNAYAASDVFITPSVCLDTFGLVNVEAMNYRKPVVGTVFGGTGEVVEHGVTGYIENPFDVDAFASRVAELLNDAELRRTMGAAGYARLLDKFSMPRLARDMLAIYGDCRAMGAAKGNRG